MASTTASERSSTKMHLEKIVTSSGTVMQMVSTQKAAYARWQNPILSVLSLFAGFVLCVGHHIFYSCLNDRIVSTQPYVLRQWSVSIGTAFAFLAHSCLSISIGITFWQLFWSTLHKKSLKLSTIDSLADSWRSVLKLFDWRVVKASPLLVFLGPTALVFNPIATMFPPGTLRTRVDYLEATFHDQIIEVPAWDSPRAFGTFSSRDGRYLGPTRNLVRATCATACQMDIPTLPRLQGVPNATYEIQMYTPTVQCQEISSDILSNFSSLFNCTAFNTCSNRQNVYTYLSWAPQCNGTVCAANTNVNVAFDGPLPEYARNIGTPGYGPAQMYIATLNGNPNTDWTDFSNWQTLNCSLHNASQVANFSFTNSYSHASFDPFKRRILNPITLADDGVIANNTPTEQSYLSLMDALGGILSGTVYWNHDYEEWLVADTVILDSKLSQTPEVSQWASLTDDLKRWSSTANTTTGAPLATLIEDLFHNITFSLFAHSDFTEPQIVPTVRSMWHATHFEYTPSHLIIAYGVAISLASFITVLGYISVVKEGKSYSNRLSTVIRKMQNDELNAVMDDHARGGEEPLPKHLAQTKVQISRPRMVLFAVPVEVGGSDPVSMPRTPGTMESQGSLRTSASDRIEVAPTVLIVP